MLRDKNTFSELSFYMLCAFFTMGFMLVYVNVFKLPMVAESRVMLVALAEFAAYSAGIILFHERRNIMTAITVGLLGPLAFYVLAYYHVAGVRIAVALGAGAALSLLYAFVQIRYGHSKSRKKRRMILLGSVSLIVFSMGVSLLIPAGDYSAVKQLMYNNNDGYEYTAYREEENLDHNMEAVSKLDITIYPGLDVKSRKETLLALSHVEENYLGIPEVKIGYKELGESTLGEADYAENTVWIDSGLLKEDTSDNIVSTLLHELYHIYCYRCVVLYEKLDKRDRGLLLFRVAEMCSQDYNNYQSGEEDFEAYAEQACEVAARKYAEDGCAELYERIGAYLEEKQNEE